MSSSIGELRRMAQTTQKPIWDAIKMKPSKISFSQLRESKGRCVP